MIKTYKFGLGSIGQYLHLHLVIIKIQFGVLLIVKLMPMSDKKEKTKANVSGFHTRNFLSLKCFSTSLISIAWAQEEEKSCEWHKGF